MKKIILMAVVLFGIVDCASAQMKVSVQKKIYARVRIKNGTPCASVCESTVPLGIGQVFFPGVTNVVPCTGSGSNLNAAIQISLSSTGPWTSMPTVISPMVGCGYPTSTGVVLSGVFYTATISVPSPGNGLILIQ